MIDMFYARIDEQKTKLGIAKRNAVIRGAATERDMLPENNSHLKKKKAPSSYKSNNSHHSVKSPFQRDFCLESPTLSKNKEN
jgi:hypothetical protein